MHTHHLIHVTHADGCETRVFSHQFKPSPFITRARSFEMFENGEWHSAARDSFIAILCARERDEGKGEKLLVRRRARVKNLH